MITSSSRLLFKNLISKTGEGGRQKGDFISLVTEIGVGGYTDDKVSHNSPFISSK
jgi:hypothetical protein